MAPFDVIFVLPYPFSDHPSFPEAILKRALECEGFSVGVIETPEWQHPDSFAALGRPRLFFAVISGPVDSKVLNYTSLRKRRREDLYQHDGRAFFEDTPGSIKSKIRPDRTVIVFANRIRERFKGVPVIIGGMEGSLRLFAHYDFQEDAIRRSILLDSRAHAAVVGPGEKQIVWIAQSFRDGAGLDSTDMPGIARIYPSLPRYLDPVLLPSSEEVLADPLKFMEAQAATEKAVLAGRAIAQEHGGRFVVAHPPAHYGPEDLDFIYGLPFARAHLHPASPSPALRMNLFSVTSHRGCCGGCAFCGISAHQGRGVISRSPESILTEVRRLTAHPAWKGVVSDIGGPSAEMYGQSCGSQTPCARPSCLFPDPCRNLNCAEPYLDLLRECRAVPGVRKILLGSGARFDTLARHPELLEEIMVAHCGRFLRIAPEHTEDHVLLLMKKPPFSVLVEFVRLFRSINRRLKRRIELAPYLIVGHPGETDRDVMEMRKKLKALGLRMTDVQVFTPTPGTLSTAMFHSGRSPSGAPLPVEKGARELARRKALMTGGP